MLDAFSFKLFGIGKQDIKSFMHYLHEKVFLGHEAVDIAISRYRNIHVFANIFMKRKLDIFLNEMDEGRDIVDVLRRELFITKMEHHLLSTAQSFASGLNVIIRNDRENIDLSMPILKGFFYFSTIPSTFLPMAGDMGQGVKKMIEGIGAMRAGDSNVTVELPFFFQDPFATIAGYGSLGFMVIAPVTLVLWHLFYLPSYLKFNKLKEIEYGLSLFTPLAQMTQNGFTMHEGFEYMRHQMKHPTLAKMLREVSMHYEHGDLNMANIFKRYGFGREITDVIDEIEKSGIAPTKALTRAVESLEIRHSRVKKDYAILIAEVPRWISLVVLLVILTMGSLSYFDAFLGTSIKH